MGRESGCLTYLRQMPLELESKKGFAGTVIREHKLSLVVSEPFA